jgi:iron complex transport system substrate-binding protein
MFRSLQDYRSQLVLCFCFFASFFAEIFFVTAPLRAQQVFEDKLGRKVVVAKSPERIISLAPNITEILYALGLSHRIAGVTTFSDYPKQAKQKPKVGSYVNLNIEKIISLRPDLIIGTYGGNPKAKVLRLEELGFPVYVTRTENVEEMLGMIQDIGTITNTAEKAGVLVSKLRGRIKAVTDGVEKASRPLVFFEINAKPLITVGAGSFHNEVITLAGGRNLAADSHARYPQYSLEDVVKRGPDVILVSTMDRAGLFEQQKAQWMRWKNIPAVQNNRIYFIDSDLVDRASPRIVDGLEKMARLIHPTLF